MIHPKLDPEFQPLILLFSDYQKRAKQEKEATYITLMIETDGGYNFPFRYAAFPDGTGHDKENCFLAERLAKTLLWVVGGFKIHVAGSHKVFLHLKQAYTKEGIRSFDEDFMSGVYQRPFEVVEEDESSLPETKMASIKIGGNLKGNRIGFDAGGSDRKVSAVSEGKVVYEEEVVWSPKLHDDLEYHYDGIMSAFESAASHLPSVDGIGISSAGVIVSDRAMVSSLFLKVSKEKYGDKVHSIYLDVASDFASKRGKEIPVSVANDGDVTALAGAMDIQEGEVLGIAMGTSEAGGYINKNGGLNGWISELAFVPIDGNQKAMEDEWSLDFGVGCKYFSQDAVIKLAEMGGYRFEEGLSPAEKLKAIQSLMENDDPLAKQIYADIGVYLGYALPYYGLFYELKHVLLLGRVMSGKGGQLIIDNAKEVLKESFPEYAGLHLFTPSEKMRRVGQSIAAASLPKDL